MNKPKRKRQSSYLHMQEEWKELYESGMSYTAIGKQYNVHYTTVQNVLKNVVIPRPKQRYIHLLDEWIELYVQHEWSINQIGDKYKIDPTTISKYLKEAGLELRRKYEKPSPFDKNIPKWIEKYKSGKSLKQIADEYDTSPQIVHKHIKDKVKMRDYEETSREYSINHPDYFQKIDTHEKAYWLGIWYGTGFIHKGMGSYESSLVLAYKDRDILDRFKKTIEFNKPIEFYEASLEPGSKFISKVAKLRIHSKTFYECLYQNGLRTDKYTITSIPKTLPSELYCSFILGYYEGKGSCYIVEKVIDGNTYHQITFHLNGNEMLLNELRTIILKQTGVNMRKEINKYKRFDKSSYIFYLKTGSKENVKRLADWLYSGDAPCTKHRDVREILKNI